VHNLARAWGYSLSCWTFYIPQPPAVHLDSLENSEWVGFVFSVAWKCSLRERAVSFMVSQLSV